MEDCPPSTTSEADLPSGGWMNGKKRRMLTWLEVRSRPVRGAQEVDAPAAWQPGRGGERDYFWLQLLDWDKHAYVSKAYAKSVQGYAIILIFPLPPSPP